MELKIVLLSIPTMLRSEVDETNTLLSLHLLSETCPAASRELPFLVEELVWLSCKAFPVGSKKPFM
jgi:hypothetical protein